MGNKCTVCGGGGFWRAFFGGFRKIFSGRRNGDHYRHVPIAEIGDNPYQPRTYILAEPHDDLKMSIAQYGVIVPIIVNRKKSGGYTLVAGQRRLQAARELGLESIPSLVRTLNQREMMEVTYLENLHREDLTQVDVVKMFDRLRRKYPNVGEEDLAVAMGLDVESLRRARSLLNLPIPALEALRAGMITEEHARVVAEIPDSDLMLEAVEMVYQEKLDLEATQALIDRMLKKPARFVAGDESTHFHSPSCPFAQLIPDEKRAGYYSRQEANQRGKIACMQCL